MLRSLQMLLFVALALLVSCAAPKKEFIKDWQSMDAPKDASAIITLPAYPRSGREFEVRRTYVTSRRSRQNRATPPEGFSETLRVTDDKGTLEFWRDGEEVHAIKLGNCFSFAYLDQNHDFAAFSAPAYHTAPPDCRVWDGREWHQSYRSKPASFRNPCVYEAKRTSTVLKDSNSRRFRTETKVLGTIQDRGESFSQEFTVEYDEDLEFFNMFDVGYVGKVEVLKEVK